MVRSEYFCVILINPLQEITVVAKFPEANEFIISQNIYFSYN